MSTPVKLPEGHQWKSVDSGMAQWNRFECRKCDAVFEHNTEDGEITFEPDDCPDLKLRLTLEIDYVKNGTSIKYLKDNLHRLVTHALGEGLICGEEEAAVTRHSSTVENITRPWKDDQIQFPRLIEELQGAGAFSSKVIDELCESMDLTMEDIAEITKRARFRWENIKAGL